jgi:recombinational DNA repair ATPase RecF
VLSHIVDAIGSWKGVVSMSGILSRFRIEALHNTYTIDVPIEDNKLILIGENGTGESTLINFIYFFLTNQWQRMLSYDFKRVLAVIDGEEISFTKSELLEGKEKHALN